MRRFSISATISPSQVPGIAHQPWVRGSVPSRFKWNRKDESPYCVANEFICAELGRFIGLPIPHYAICRADVEELRHSAIFASLDFNWNGRDLSPVLPEQCLEHLLSVCTGILVFDTFIANADRHSENIAVDRMDTPKEIRIYDHEAALFGTVPGEGISRLSSLKHRLGITGQPPTGGNEHVFLRTITTMKFFSEWAEQISWLPFRYIERTCRQAKEFGITEDEATAAKIFLDYRKWNLRGIITNWRSEFTAIDRWETL